MSVKLRIKRKSLYLDIYQNGVRKWESLHISLTGNKQTDKEIMRTAEEVRTQKEMQIMRGEYGLIDQVGARKTLYSLILEVAKTRGKTNVIHRLPKWLKKYPGGETIQIKQVTSNWIELFQQFLLDRKLKPNTISVYISRISQALNKAVNENLILKNPYHIAGHIKKEDVQKDILTIQEIQLLYDTTFDTPDPLIEEVKRAFIFSCYTGLRFSDLKTLKWRHIDITDGKIYLTKIQEKTKILLSRKEVHKTACEMIDTNKILLRDNFVFELLAATSYGIALSYIKKIVEKAGINKNIGWHNGRHSATTILIDLGVNAFVAQKILGHKDIRTTQKYVHVSDQTMSVAINAIPALKTEKNKNAG